MNICIRTNEQLTSYIESKSKELHITKSEFIRNSIIKNKNKVLSIQELNNEIQKYLSSSLDPEEVLWKMNEASKVVSQAIDMLGKNK